MSDPRPIIEALVEALHEAGPLTSRGDAALAAGRHWLAEPVRPGPPVKSATLAALAEVDAGAPIAPTARKHGLAASTLFRALAKRRETPAAGGFEQLAQDMAGIKYRKTGGTP